MEKNKELEFVNEELLKLIKKKFSRSERKHRRKEKGKSEGHEKSQELKRVEEVSSDNKTIQALLDTFDKVDQWNFDVFSIEKNTGGHSLFVTGYTLFVKYDLLNKFNIPEKVLINFLKEVEANYHPNPYHNSMHAADVLQVLHYIIYKGGLSSYLSDEDIMGALISAIIHDFDHPGLNNTFQINAQSYLATLYNDRAVSYFLFQQT